MQFYMVLLYLASILLILYSLLINLYLHWFKKLRLFIFNEFSIPQTSFSIIIPARNEEQNIGACIESICKTDYPKHLFEIIVVDDFSDDDTVKVVTLLQRKYSNLSVLKMQDVLNEKINSYKKKAIETAIANANNKWIITTDADCILPAKWLNLFDAYIQKNDVVFLAAPVMFTNTGTLLSIFQCLDFISLQGITASSVAAGFHSMCNGANLAYRKDVFNQVKGFKGLDDIASGDDMLLMHKIQKRYPFGIGYLFSSDAIVKTCAMPSWKSFFNQRIRWASKSTSYSDKRIILVLLLVYFTNLLLLILLGLVIIDFHFLFYFLELVVLKGICEFPFMYASASFFKMKSLLKWFVILQPMHIFYIILSGFLGKFGSYEWKGRRVK